MMRSLKLMILVSCLFMAVVSSYKLIDKQTEEEVIQNLVKNAIEREAAEEANDFDEEVADEDEDSEDFENDELEREFLDDFKEQVKNDPRPWLFWGRKTSSGKTRSRRFFRRLVNYGRRFYEKTKARIPKLLEHGRKIYQASRKHLPGLHKLVRTNYPQTMSLVEKILKKQNKSSERKEPLKPKNIR